MADKDAEDVFFPEADYDIISGMETLFADIHFLDFVHTLVKVLSWFAHHPPAAVGVTYLVMSLITFGFYFHDKRAAQKGKWRTPESTLHLLELLFGWPGALLAQRYIRHKSSKRSYQIVFWLMVVLNLAAVAYMVHVWFRS